MKEFWDMVPFVLAMAVLYVVAIVTVFGGAVIVVALLLHAMGVL
jgi:hypothetical protein